MNSCNHSPNTCTEPNYQSFFVTFPIHWDVDQPFDVAKASPNVLQLPTDTFEATCQVSKLSVSCTPKQQTK